MRRIRCVCVCVCAVLLVHCCSLFYAKEYRFLYISLSTFLLKYFVVGIKVAVSFVVVSPCLSHVLLVLLVSAVFLLWRSGLNLGTASGVTLHSRG
jgi:hypothetical protein